MDPNQLPEKILSAVCTGDGYGVCRLSFLQPTAMYRPNCLQCKVLLHLSDSTGSREILASLYQTGENQTQSQAELCKHI